MPALVVCGKHWLVASDDFVLPALAAILVRLPWWVVLQLADSFIGWVGLGAEELAHGGVRPLLSLLKTCWELWERA